MYNDYRSYLLKVIVVYYKLLFIWNVIFVFFNKISYCEKLLKLEIKIVFSIEFVFFKESEFCMVILYSFLSCMFCRKVKLWLEENYIFYIECNIFLDLLMIEEIKEILCMIESGMDEIIFICLKVF